MANTNAYILAMRVLPAFSRLDKPRHELSLLSIRNGDSTQVRKIKFEVVDNRVQMQLDETEFAYRMGADTSRRYKEYTFHWNGKWALSGMRLK